MNVGGLLYVSSTITSTCRIIYTTHSHGYTGSLAFVKFKPQVVELWQRDRMKRETFSIKVQRYSQNHAHNYIFGPPYVRIGRNVSSLFESFNAKKLCAELHRENASFTCKTAN